MLRLFRHINDGSRVRDVILWTTCFLIVSSINYRNEVNSIIIGTLLKTNKPQLCASYTVDYSSLPYTYKMHIGLIIATCLYEWATMQWQNTELPDVAAHCGPTVSWVQDQWTSSGLSVWAPLFCPSGAQFGPERTCLGAIYRLIYGSCIDRANCDRVTAWAPTGPPTSRSVTYEDRVNC